MTAPSGVARDQLRAIVDRIERLEEEKAALADDIKVVYAEAKANGFDTKTIRRVIKLRKIDAAERQEQESLLDLYMHALGMLADTPLGEAAAAKEKEGLTRRRRVRDPSTGEIREAAE